eukprot:6191045-Pleurochrysis_carterae.AAC.3
MKGAGQVRMSRQDMLAPVTAVGHKQKPWPEKKPRREASGEAQPPPSRDPTGTQVKRRYAQAGVGKKKGFLCHVGQGHGGCHCVVATVRWRRARFAVSAQRELAMPRPAHIPI